MKHDRGGEMPGFVPSPVPPLRLLPAVTFRWWETALMRFGFALLLWSVYPHDIPYRDMPFPTGLAHFLDLTWFAEPENFRIGFFVFLVGAAGYVVGAGPFLSLTAMLVPFVFAATIINSQGAISHYYQLLALILTGQWACAFYFLLKNRGRWRESLAFNSALQSQLVAVALQVIAANYMLSGVTKLTETRGAWLWQAQYMPVQYEKIRLQHYYETLQPDAVTLGSQLNQLCLKHPSLTILFYGPGLLLELLTPLILLGRRWSFWTGLAVLLMHRLIAVTMNVEFTQHEWVILIFAINLPYWIARGLGKIPRLEPAPSQPSALSWHALPKLRWFFASIFLGLVLKENFPFSNWPMYSSFRPRATVFYIENAAGQPIATRVFGGLSAPRMKRIAEKYSLAEKDLGATAGKSTALIYKERGAEKSLAYFKSLVPDTALLAETETLTLVELTIRLEKTPQRKLVPEAKRLATISAR